MNSMLTQAHLPKDNNNSPAKSCLNRNELTLYAEGPKATKSDLRLPNLEGVSAVDFKKYGYITALKGGRNRPD